MHSFAALGAVGHPLLKSGKSGRAALAAGDSSHCNLERGERARWRWANRRRHCRVDRGAGASRAAGASRGRGVRWWHLNGFQTCDRGRQETVQRICRGLGGQVLDQAPGALAGREISSLGCAPRDSDQPDFLGQGMQGRDMGLDREPGDRSEQVCDDLRRPCDAGAPGNSAGDVVGYGIKAVGDGTEDSAVLGRECLVDVVPQESGGPVGQIVSGSPSDRRAARFTATSLPI